MAQRKDARESVREETNTRLSDVAARAQESIERLENAFGAFWEEASGDDVQPYLRHLARANIEVIRLLGRQTKAYAELPARLVSCNSPQEAWMEQLQFYRQAFNDYQASTSRIFDAMTQTALSQAREVGGEMVVGPEGLSNGSSSRSSRRDG